MTTVPSHRSDPQAGLRGLVLLSALILAAVVAIRPIARPPAHSMLPTTDGFTVSRALEDLEVITEEPRVPGSDGYAAAREYLVAEFEALGLEPQVTDALSVRAGAGGANVGRAQNVVARIPGTDSTGAILLAGHLDTVHTTVGASDCGGCSVAVVETARALLAGPPLRNDVILLLEDGEETTRAGSLSFVEQHPWAEDVRVAINLEAMGSQGGSILYVTGPDNGWLIREALRAMPAPVAYSSINDLVWLSGTGGSDLDQFLLAAEVGLGLVYAENTPVYHTMADDVAHLNPQTLQHQGATMVALARHFGGLPLNDALRRDPFVYFNLLGYQVIRYPAAVGVVFALLAVSGTVATVVIGLQRDRLTGAGIVAGAVGFLPLLLGATLIPGALWFLLRVLDPRLQVFLIGVTYDRPWYTLAFVTLSAGVTWAGYGLMRRRSSADLGVGAQVCWAILAGVTAFLLPGSSYVFTLPTLLATVMFVLTLFAEEESVWIRTLILALGAAGIVLVVAPVVHFLGIFSGRAELLMGLPLIAMLPAPFIALLVGLLLPVFDVLSQGRRLLGAAVLVGLAVLILIGVTLTARFTPVRPKPNMVAYVLDADTGTAEWVTGGANVAGRRASLLDEWTSQFFTEAVIPGFYSPWGAYAPDTVPAYRESAPRLNLPAPEVEVLEDRVDEQGRRQLRLRLLSPRDATMMVARLSTEGQIVRATVAGQPMPGVSAEAPLSRLDLGLHAVAGDGIEVTLAMAEGATLTLQLEDHVYRLPEVEGLEVRPRPAWMMPSPTFVSDATLVRRTVTLP